MNILFVHEVEWLDKVVFDIHHLSESLSRFGHNVFAIDYEDSWVRNSPLDFGSLKTRQVTEVARACPGARVSLRRPGYIKIPGLGRLSAVFTHYLEIQKTIREKGIDIIVLYSVPTNGLQTIHLAGKFRIPVIFRAIDVLNQLVPYPALRPLTRVLERKVYSSVDLILTLTPTLSRYVIDKGALKSKVKMLPISVDTNSFYPSANSDEIRQRWGLGDQEPIIIFMGTLFDFTGLDLFIHQFPKVIEQASGAKLLIVGDGPQRLKLERIITQLGLGERVIITGFQPYEMMPQYINLATICINPFLVVKATGDIFPGKIVQYLACGKVVVATPLPGMIAVIPDQQQGVIYANNAGEMVNEVVSLLKSTERRQQLEYAGVKYAKEVHSQERVARQFEKILEEAIKEKQYGTTSKRV